MRILLLLLTALSANAQTWPYVGNYFPLNPPDFSTFSWVNQNTASWANVGGFPVVAVPYQIPSQFNNLTKALPGSTYTCTISFTLATPQSGSVVTGLTLQSGTSAVNFFINLYQITGSLVVTHETVAGGPISGSTETVMLQSDLIPDGQVRALRIVEDGAHRTFYFSADGGTAFVPVYQEASGAFITPGSWGIVAFNRGTAGVTAYSTIYNLSVTTP